jgi:plastocyanin
VSRGSRVGRRGWRLLAVAGALSTFALGASACSSGPANPAQTTRSSASAAPHHIALIIKNFTFVPARFTVAPGATISITNKDSVTHTFTLDSGQVSTGDITPGSTKTVTAPDKAGTYTYRCMIHQFMTGTFVVR